jgi:tRNA1Val (adenine37-N6)-methyltransferase
MVDRHGPPHGDCAAAPGIAHIAGDRYRVARAGGLHRAPTQKPGACAVADILLTEGTLLGGAIRYAQPRAGYRTGIEPVFLAAAVPARAGERVLEAGTGAGAGLLCLTHRLAGLHGLGVEIEPAMARVATGNLAANGQRAVTILAGDIRALPASIGAFDHAMANPPWHDDAGSHPPGALRQRAKMAPPGLLSAWIGAMARVLRHRGTLTLILPPRAVPEALAALAEAGCGSALLFPLWPKPGREARILLIQASRGGRADLRLLPGLVLHDEAGYTPAAEAVLRGGEALVW